MKEKNNVIMMEIFVIIFAVIALIFAISTYLSKKNTNNKVQLEEEEVIEEVVDENAEYKNILAIINLLNTDNNNSISDIYSNEINISDIDKQRKIYSILYSYYLESKYEEDSSENEFGEIIVNKYIRKDVIVDEYKRIYNEEIEDYIYEENMCPSFSLVENSYYIDDSCGKKNNNKIISYIYKKVIGKNSIDIYLAMGALIYKDRSYNIYRYEDYIDGVDNILLNTDSEVFFSFNDSNYKDFSLFLVHFIRREDGIYFSSIRRAL